MKSRINSLYFYNDGKSLQIEISSICNNDCKMCFGQRFDLHPKQHIEFDNFIKILDIYQPTFLRIVGRGETLIHPRINDILSEIKKRKIVTTLTTNLNMPDLDFQLIKDTISETYISLHSFKPETYLKLTGRKIDNVINNIQKFDEYKINYHLKMIISKYNENEIEDFMYKSIALEKYYWISGLDFGVNEIDDLELKQKLIDELYPTSEDSKYYSRYLNQGLEIRKHKKCNTAKTPYVLYNGDMYSCCLAAKSGYLGNIFDKDFKLDESIMIKMQNRGGDECKICPLN